MKESKDFFNENTTSEMHKIPNKKLQVFDLSLYALFFIAMQYLLISLFLSIANIFARVFLGLVSLYFIFREYILSSNFFSHKRNRIIYVALCIGGLLCLILFVGYLQIDFK